MLKETKAHLLVNNVPLCTLFFLASSVPFGYFKSIRVFLQDIRKSLKLIRIHFSKIDFEHFAVYKHLGLCCIVSFLYFLYNDFPYDRENISEIFELIVDTVSSKRKTIRIAGDDKPADVVKSRFMKLDYSHISYVVDCMKKNDTEIKNIKQYILAALYNASMTISSFYQAMYNNDHAKGLV